MTKTTDGAQPADKGGVFSPSGKLVATTREVRLWAVDSVPAQYARRLPPVFENPAIQTITFTRDGSHLVAAEDNGAWTLETGSGRIKRAFSRRPSQA